MNKLPIFKPSLITNEIFPKGTSPEVINYGKCFIWAYSAFLIFKDIDLCDVDCHAFVLYKGRFYDSETLRGSVDWRDLPATRFASTTAKVWSPGRFKREWRGNPKKYGTTWKAIEANAQKVLERVQATI